LHHKILLFAGFWFDKSAVLGFIATAMKYIFSPEYKNSLDRLWDAYFRSESPAHEKDLEDLLNELEARYFGEGGNAQARSLS